MERVTVEVLASFIIVLCFIGIGLCTALLLIGPGKSQQEYQMELIKEQIEDFARKTKELK
jgi:hypothetical protein